MTGPHLEPKLGVLEQDTPAPVAWGLLDVAQGVAAVVGISLLAFIIAAIVLMGDEDKASDAIFLLGLTALLQVAFVGVVWRFSIVRHAAEWSSLGLRFRWKPSSFLIVPTAVIGMLIVLAIYALAVDAIGWHKDSDPLFDDERTGIVVVASFLAIAVAPVFEEIFFRGFMLQGIMRHVSPLKAAAVTSILFALAHIDPFTYIPIFCIGMILGLVFLKTRSLPIAIASHGLYNSVVVGVSVATDSNSWIRVGSL